MHLALVQLNVEGEDVEANVARAEAAIADAAERGADLVALPEIFNVGYFAFDAYQRNAEGLGGPTLTRMRDAAAEHGVGVLAGSIVEDLAASREAGDAPTPTDDGLANTSVLFDRDGTRLSVYRKHHLFGYESAEARLLVPGERLPVTEFEGFTVATTTCYDLRFPELYRDLADQGATLVLVPSAWPYPRVEHWRTLSRARAIENLGYVATINGAGEFEDATLLGRSTVYDPWGTAVASTDDDPDTIHAEVSPERVEAVREEFPALRDRRQ
jgi:predicted amidohydrolase